MILQFRIREFNPLFSYNLFSLPTSTPANLKGGFSQPEYYQHSCRNLLLLYILLPISGHRSFSALPLELGSFSSQQKELSTPQKSQNTHFWRQAVQTGDTVSAGNRWCGRDF